MRFFTASIQLSMMAIHLLVAPAADGASPPEAVLAEYARALVVLEAKYSQIRGSGERVEVRLDAPSGPQEIRSGDTFAIDGECKKYAQIWEGEAAGKTYDERVLCVNGEYAFALKRSAASGPFLISDIGPGGGRNAPEGLEHFQRRYLAAPYSLFQMEPISKILAHPTFALRSVAEIPGEERKLLRIEFTYRPDKEYPAIPTWITVAPEEGWVLHEFEGGFGPKSDIIRGGTVEYDPDPDGGPPLPRLVTFTHPTYRRTFRFDHVEFGPSPKQEFTLTYYGLPEPTTPARSDYSSRLHYWLISGGIILFATALVLRYAARRGGPSTSGGAR